MAGLKRVPVGFLNSIEIASCKARGRLIAKRNRAQGSRPLTKKFCNFLLQNQKTRIYFLCGTLSNKPCSVNLVQYLGQYPYY